MASTIDPYKNHSFEPCFYADKTPEHQPCWGDVSVVAIIATQKQGGGFEVQRDISACEGHRDTYDSGAYYGEDSPATRETYRGHHGDLE